MTAAVRGHVGGGERSVALHAGAMAILKLVGVALMVGDHINKHLLQGRVEALYDAGRVAFPLFALIFAFNLARPGFLSTGPARRTLLRLIASGLVASIPFIALGHLVGGWWPLNILFTLTTALGVQMLWHQGGLPPKVLAVMAFVVGGGLVEFWWPGVGLVLAASAYFRRRSGGAAIAGALCFALLCWINGNAWALASVPLMASAAVFDLPNPGLPRWAFYAVYPGHLAILWAAQAAIA